MVNDLFPVLCTSAQTCWRIKRISLNPAFLIAVCYLIYERNIKKSKKFTLRCINCSCTYSLKAESRFTSQREDKDWIWTKISIKFAVLHHPALSCPLCSPGAKRRAGCNLSKLQLTVFYCPTAVAKTRSQSGRNSLD